MTVASRLRTAEEFDLRLPSGVVHAQRFGPRDAPLVIAVPGVTANMKTFDFIGERLSNDLQFVAVDPRGRGRSEVTPPGTYVYPNHARDVIALAATLGAQT
jgi:pimeloyl-ACP methyl ester carboxylesterase